MQSLIQFHGYYWNADSHPPPRRRICVTQTVSVIHSLEALPLPSDSQAECASAKVNHSSLCQTRTVPWARAVNFLSGPGARASVTCSTEALQSNISKHYYGRSAAIKHFEALLRLGCFSWGGII